MDEFREESYRIRQRLVEAIAAVMMQAQRVRAKSASFTRAELDAEIETLETLASGVAAAASVNRYELEAAIATMQSSVIPPASKQ